MEETEALMQSGWDGAETMSGYGLINKYTLWVPEHMILDHDIYQRARYSIMDIEIDGESLALETVKAVGPGGHFLGQAHTRRHMRETTKPAITHVPGPDGGFLDPVEAARKRAELILRTYQPEPLEPAKAAELARIVAAADAELR
jgi:trimethylamine--corrinoid protein Co-methyltransferase